MAKIKKIGVMSFVRLHTLIGGIVGLILGVIYAFGGLLIDALVSLGWIISQETPGLSYGTVLAFGALLGMPVIFAGFGGVVGLIGGVVYNIFARWFGGIDIEFKKK